MEGTIIEKSEERTIQTRFGQALYAQVILRDETKEIKLSLWRGQVEMVNVGDRVRIENGIHNIRRA
ncbi:MAG: hypothetical protein WED04_07490 [Promethearchaeati archaeon SRVP18_Atabeyarchaeia-1]